MASALLDAGAASLARGARASLASARCASASDGGAATWPARLALRIECVSGRSIVAARVHHGPLRVQKALHPEGPTLAQVMVVHPPGGIAGGDHLELDVEIGATARAQLTTPGAAKWYRSIGRRASQTVAFRVQRDALLEWLPLDNIVFSGARAATRTTIDLAAGATCFAWDVTCLGRTASGERFDAGEWRHSFELSRDATIAFAERGIVGAGSRFAQSPVGLNAMPVFGTFVAAADAVDDDARADCRAVRLERGEGAITRIERVLVARYRGDSTSAARAWFVALWRVLRPRLAGVAAQAPRIWST